MESSTQHRPRDRNRKRLAALLKERAVGLGWFPLTHGQRALWFLHELDPQSSAYHLPFILVFRERINFEAIQHALEFVVARHGALRTVFRSHAGCVQQVELSQVPCLVEHKGVAGASDSELRRHLRESLRRPFNWSQGPMWRVTVFSRSPEEHVFLLSIHHIVFDGISAGIFAKEFQAAYLAYSRGGVPDLGPATGTYRNYVRWQEQWLEGPEAKCAKRYWLGQFREPLPILDLPTDRPRPAVQTYGGATWKFEIEPRLTAAVKGFAAAEGTTLFTVLLAGFQTLLNRYTGQCDIITGSPTVGRMEPGFERVMGYFVNMVAIRGAFTENLTFRDFVRQMTASVKGAVAHQGFPFPLLVRELKLPRDPSRSPLFQVEFNLETWIRDREGAGSEAILDSLGGDPFFWVNQEGEFDLCLDLFDLGATLSGGFRFNPDLFDRMTIYRLSEHFRVLIEELIAAPDQPVSSAGLLTEVERRRLVVEWNRTERPMPDDCLPGRIARRAFERPDKIAVRCANTQVTYDELNRQSNQLARFLRERGVGNGSTVGICLDRSMEMVVALIGVLKSGAAYVPLDPAHPKERLRFVIADAGLEYILARHSTASEAEIRVERCLLIEDIWPKLMAYSDHDLEPLWCANDAAYVIYTSGSTGRPKGVEIPHGALTNFLQSMACKPGLDENDVLLAVTTLSFDIAGLELYLPLWVGGEVVVARSSETADGGQLLALLRRCGATAMQGTPATWKVLLDSGWREPLPLKIFCGGDSLDRPLAERLLELGKEVWNLFGPTETTIWSSVGRVESGSGPVPIGRPIDNTQVYVLDERLQLVPQGVPGELYFGGAGLARGYRNRPELTAERFLSDPFCSEPGRRIYRTGDLVRFRPDGQLVFLGRRDFQVKIRGFRIELGEIEAALLLEPQVREAVVIARTDHSSEKQLVAYVVLEAGADFQIAPLREHLRARLPEYMVPSAFVPMDSFPLTPNGKIDRRALPAPEFSRAGLSGKWTPAKSEIERTLARIWAHALGRPEVGVNDNFFELGGHSVLAAQVVASIREHHPIELLDLFTYPTIRLLAGRLGDLIPHAPASGSVKPSGRLAQSSDGGVMEIERGIAIVGMAGRFPGAGSVAEFWENLRNGVESISFFNREELLAAGVKPELLDRPDYVRAGGRVTGADLFDAEFFGFSAAQARMIDPQHRLLLECAWEALEHAGCDPDQEDGSVGVYVAVAPNTYYHPDLRTVAESQSLALMSMAHTAFDKDFAATRISYKLNLRGPSFTVQTACSSSLVAVHLACQSLWNDECRVALAGGASLFFPQTAGYIYQREMILSPDGHCRTFDAKAQGTLFTNGLALVALKPLERALADGDCIYAVIKGSAINNDGAWKVDYMAPSVQGQCDVITRALARSGVAPETIELVEAHGTGTSVGDPIEVKALQQVLAQDHDASKRCALGSVKSNVGHLNTAAGIAGLIKTALCLKEETFVPSLHFESPNPQIDFENSPFYVNTKLQKWTRGSAPRRAAVSSFGIGGTNAHVILEEPLMARPAVVRRSWRLITLSARSQSGLDRLRSNLARHLKDHTETDLGSLAYTLQTGRRSLDFRFSAVCSDLEEAIRVLETPPKQAGQPDAAPPVVFLFPDRSAELRDFARELYESEPDFRRNLDDCLNELDPDVAAWLRNGVMLSGRTSDDSAPPLEKGSRAMAALIEFALARTWISWGIRPEAVAGSGVGEYAAGCLAEVFSLEDMIDVLLKEDGAVPRLSHEAATFWENVPLKAPRILIRSASTGGALSVEEASDAAYWCTANQRPATWSHEAGRNLDAPDRLFLRMGLGEGSTDFFGAAAPDHGERVLGFLVGSSNRTPVAFQILNGLRRLWQGGHTIDWRAYYREENLRKIPLPTYPFERARHWMDEPRPILTNSIPTTEAAKAIRAEDGAMVVRSRLEGSEFFIEDHVLSGRRILPGVYYLELARHAVETAFPDRNLTRLAGFGWARPVVFEGHPIEIEVQLRAGTGDRVSLEITTNSSLGRKVHARGQAVFESACRPSTQLVEGIRERCTEFRTGEEIYHEMRERGVEYGSRFRPIENLWSNSEEALAELGLSNLSADGLSLFDLHPTLLEGAVQSVLGLTWSEQHGAGTPHVPYSLGEIEMISPLEPECFAHARWSAERVSEEIPAFDIDVTNPRGEVLLRLRDYAVRFIRTESFGLASPQNGRGSPRPWLYRTIWEEAPCTIDSVEEIGSVLLWVEHKGFGDAFSAALRRRGIDCTIIGLEGKGAAPSRLDFFRDENRRWDRFCLVFDDSGGNPESETKRDLAHFQTVFEMIQDLLSTETGKTANGLVIELGANSGPEASAMSALARSLRHETAMVNLKTIHVVNERMGEELADLLISELRDHQPQKALDIRYENGRRLAKRIVHDDAVLDLVRVEGDGWPESSARPGDLVEVMRRKLPDTRRENRLENYSKLLAELGTLSAGYAWQALERLGLKFENGWTCALSTLKSNLRILDQHERLLERLCEILAEEKWIEMAEGRLVCRAVQEPPPPASELDRLLRQYPLFKTDLDLLGRCGEHLADVLRGRCNALELLFPGGSTAPLEEIYKNSPQTKALNDLVREAMVHWCDRAPRSKPIRILEVGAGTGATTSCLLPLLPSEGTDYVFSDLSPQFLTKGRERFADYPFVHFKILDLETPPGAQGFTSESFDAIVATNVLHATSRLSRTLDHLQRLLRPGGLLLAVESVGRQRWADLVFGLTEGWWKFADRELRPSYPLLRPDQWKSLLEEGGWANASIVGGESEDLGQSIVIAAAAPVKPAPPHCRPEATYLISGGTGQLGWRLAKYLAETYQANLVLLGRSELNAETRAAIASLGAPAVYLPCDITSRKQTNRAVELARERFGSLHGVFHCGAVIDDAPIVTKDFAAFESILAPKIFGAWNLDAATKSEPLEFFAMFSSMSAVTGVPGQCDYTAANGFLDGFVEWREARRAQSQRNGATVSLGWLLWEISVERVGKPAEKMMLAHGLKPLNSELAWRGLERALASGPGHRLIVDGERDSIDRLFGATPREGSAMDTPQLAGANQANGELTEELKTMLGRIVGVSPGEIQPGVDMDRYGLDSVGTIDFVSQINQAHGLNLSPAILFEHKTLSSLEEFLIMNHAAALGRVETPVPAPASMTRGNLSAPPAPRSSGEGVSSGNGTQAKPMASAQGRNDPNRTTEPIAVVGMQGIFPKSPDLDTFWEHLVRGEDMISEIPADRWDWKEYFGNPYAEPNKTQVKWGGFITGVDRFDARFFHLSRREAEVMDPQHRLFLQLVWNTIEDAGHSPSSLSGSRTGIFAGVSTGDYHELMTKQVERVELHSASGVSFALLPNRISYLLNLRGPSEAIDTACSSSLVAVHRAMEAIRQGECDQAIAGGVNLLLSPTGFIYFDLSGMLAPDGRCKTFDQSGNGFARGEGLGAVFLKPLSQALADRDSIYGLLKSSAVNHSGRTKSPGALDPRAVAEVVMDALRKGQIDPASIGYIEAHGVGTALGDPIEVNGLKKAFAEIGNEHSSGGMPWNHCGLGSAKTNIGHLEAAAGIAALIKVLLAVRHRKLPPMVHFKQLNPFIELVECPFFIVDQLRDWMPSTDSSGRPQPLRAGVNSIGFGGVNAHVLVEEYVDDATPLDEEGNQSHPVTAELIVLSARNEDRLQACGKRLLEWLESRPNSERRPLRLADLAFTLQVGRDAMAKRVAILVSSLEELKAKLRVWLESGESTGVQRGAVMQHGAARIDSVPDEEVRRLVERDELAALAELWIQGANIDWSIWPREERARRISVPGYSFAPDSYWLPRSGATPGQGSAAAEAPGRNAPLASAQPINERASQDATTERAFFELILDEVKAGRLTSRQAEELIKNGFEANHS